MKPIAVLTGMIASTPGQGGATAAALQWALGLERCGYDVVALDLLERTEQPLGVTPAARYLDALDVHGRDIRLALWRPASGEVHGIDPVDLARLLRRAEVVFDVSGTARSGGALADVPVRVYLDLDPLFNQAWHAVDGIDMGFAGHTHHVTVGLCVGSPGCLVPTCGIDWITSLPPVDLPSWPVGGRVETDALTTVGQWRSYGPVHVDGVAYGQRAHSVRRLLELPERSPKPVRIAVDIHPGDAADRAALDRHGWQLVDPAAVAGDPSSYARFVRGSWAELSLAKSGYVDSRSGWTSDRSAAYLASGRPVVALDTGFSAHVPTGRGLLAFDDVDAAVAAVEAVLGDEDGHRRAARELAGDLFDAGRVVGRILDRVAAR